MGPDLFNSLNLPRSDCNTFVFGLTSPHKSSELQPMWEAKENPDQPMSTARISRKKGGFGCNWEGAGLCIHRLLDNNSLLDTEGLQQRQKDFGQLRLDTPLARHPNLDWRRVATRRIPHLRDAGIPVGGLPGSAHLLCSSGDPRAIEGVWPAGFRESLSSDEAYRIDTGLWYGLERHFHVLPGQVLGKNRPHRPNRFFFFGRCQKEASGLECKAMN